MTRTEEIARIWARIYDDASDAMVTGFGTSRQEAQADALKEIERLTAMTDEEYAEEEAKKRAEADELYAGLPF